MKACNNNMKSIKKHLTDTKVLSIYSQFITVLGDKIGTCGCVNDNNIEYEEKINTDLHRCYFDTNKQQLKDKFLKLKLIKKNNMNAIVENRMGGLCEMVLVLAWILGCGNDNQLNRLIKAGKNFGYMYQIALDFENIDKDLDRIVENRTFNYVLNCGIQDSYEKFMECKQKFIEECLILDIFHSTVREIVDAIETKVDLIIENSTYDIKSCYSILN